ncbi:MAG: tetratricopeptide repeat protein [Planctomycetes bacterium]|nr:tetratricopeptide repeat protein [Planctomycetota bacterium]
MRPFILITAFLAAGCVGGSSRGLPSATLQERRAEKMFESGRVAEAKAVFEQAAQMQPRPFLASIGIARCAIRLGDQDLATAAFRLAYASAPGTPEATDLLGRTHLEAAKATTGARRVQHATTSASMFSSASRLAPDLPALAYHTGMSKLLSGHPVPAVTFLELALAKDPTSTDVLHALVLAWRRLGQRDRIVALLAPYEKQGQLSPALVKELHWARSSKVGGGGQERRP